MQVKGTGIKTTKEFVKTNFPKQFNNWIDSLSPKSKELYSVNTGSSSWFPLKDAYMFPVDKMIEMLYKSVVKSGAEALGRLIAEYPLKGVYKVFLFIASLQYLMKRAIKIITSFYHPSKIDVIENGSNSIILKIKEFEQIYLALEYRTISRCTKALELVYCKNANYSIQQTLTKNDSETEIIFSWESFGFY